VTDSTETVIPFDQVDYDTDNMYTAPDTITINTGGTYYIQGLVTWANGPSNNDVGSRKICIQDVSSGNDLCCDIHTPATLHAPYSSVHDTARMVRLTQGQQLRMTAQHDQGAEDGTTVLNIIVVPFQSVIFSAYRVSD
jgi:hypothetical protein